MKTGLRPEILALHTQPCFDDKLAAKVWVESKNLRIQPMRGVPLIRLKLECLQDCFNFTIILDSIFDARC